MADPRPPDPLVEQAIEEAKSKLTRETDDRAQEFITREVLRDFAARVREPLEKERDSRLEAANGSIFQARQERDEANRRMGELEAANADLILQRDKAERQRSEALTQQDTRLEFCRQELAAERAFCICGCPPGDHESYGDEGEACENEAHECIRVAAAVVQIHGSALQREAALREALKGMLMSMDAGWELDRAGHDWPEACERARAALSGASSPATSKKENE